MTGANQPDPLGSDATNSRQQKRAPLRLPVSIISTGSAGEVCHDGECVDISEGGVAFVTAADLNVGEVVDLKFSLEGREIQSCQVKLAYRMRRRYGGYFVGTAPIVRNIEPDPNDGVEVGWPI